jgi:hypothetical protein
MIWSEVDHMGGLFDRYRAWRYRHTYGAQADHSKALAELDRRRNARIPRPFCDCPRDEDFGARLHEHGCPVVDWLNDEAQRRKS